MGLTRLAPKSYQETRSFQIFLFVSVLSTMFLSYLLPVGTMKKPTDSAESGPIDLKELSIN